MESYQVTLVSPKVVELRKAELPKISQDQILIETITSLISTGTELTYVSGEYPDGSVWAEICKPPRVLGYCNVGRIIEKGKNVKGVEIGDRIVSLSSHSQFNILSSPGPFGEFKAMKIPDGVSDEEASFTILAIGVMNSIRLAKISLGESVGVVGLGLLGQFAIIWSKLSGAYPVIGVDLSEGRLNLAKISGTDETINPQKENVDEKIKLYTKNRMLDVFFEVTGNPKVIPWAIKLTKPQGRFVILSSPRGKTELDFHDEVNSPSRIIIGTHFGSQPQHETPYNPWTWARNTELFFNLLSKKKIKIEHLISHVYDWKEAPSVYQELLKDRSKFMGVLFRWMKA